MTHKKQINFWKLFR